MKTKKTKDTIIKKYELLVQDLEYKVRCKIQNQRRILLNKSAIEVDRKIEKYVRKQNAYLNRKKTEYDRKCKNEIRKLEGKEERVYKTKKKVFNLVEFAAELMQENSKLRDTDISGNTLCISCGKFKTWKELA